MRRIKKFFVGLGIGLILWAVPLGAFVWTGGNLDANIRVGTTLLIYLSLIVGLAYAWSNDDPYR